jgi:GTPase Era involved in 16S rRNA processing
LFISDVPLLKHVTIVDTPGWNADSKAFGEDFRLRRSQTEVSDVDAWVYLTSAYEFDSLHENIRMIKGLTQDNAPGLIAITCFDVAKDQRDRGLQYCIGQKAAAVGMIFEGTSAVAQKKESIPLSCSKLYSDYISLTQLKSEIPKAVAKGDTAKANQLKAQVRKRWSAFLDYLNNTLDFILKEESNKECVQTRLLEPKYNWLIVVLQRRR